MENLEYNFSHENLESELKTFSQKKIKQLYVHDKKIATDKKSLIHFLECASRDIQDVYINLKVFPDVIDNQVLSLLQNFFCSLEIPFTENQNTKKDKNIFLFDKKLYSKKATLLNDVGIVFGFDIDFALSNCDSFKQFRDRFDFAFTLYPNHINFSQLQNDFELKEKCTGTYSSQDIEYSKKIATSSVLFYTNGRAVPWFNLVLAPLKINPSKFFSDFAEWCECNNVSLDNFEKIQMLPQKEIEKMQLHFLKIKFEEKNKTHLFQVVKDIVKLYGAFSRVDFENEETVLKLSYNPDDLLSPATLNLLGFAENVCMEECSIKVFAGTQSPEYKFI